MLVVAGLEGAGSRMEIIQSRPQQSNLSLWGFLIFAHDGVQAIIMC